LKKFNQVRNSKRPGSATPGALANLAVTAIVVAGIEYTYNEYVDKGWEVGVSLATRVGLGRALQILGAAGDLPNALTFDFVYPGGRVVHIDIVPDKDGTWYFTAWHKESVWYWLYGLDDIVYDIPMGKVPVEGFTPKAASEDSLHWNKWNAIPDGRNGGLPLPMQPVARTAQ
jgi:hypothetical protein